MLEKTLETGGENLLKGLQNMLADIGKGQLTHTAPDAFEVGRNLATTPGKVVKRTALYELIQYSPTTDNGAGDAAGHLPAMDQPLLHPRPDAGEELHPLGGGAGPDRVHGVVEVGRRVDEGRGVGRLCRRADRRDRHDPRAARRRRRSTRSAIASRAPRWRRRWRCSPRAGEADKVASATFFTAQVDFAAAGELLHFVDDDQLG